MLDVPFGSFASKATIAIIMNIIFKLKTKLKLVSKNV